MEVVFKFYEKFPSNKNLKFLQSNLKRSVDLIISLKGPY
jgi:hypothetical protein